MLGKKRQYGMITVEASLVLPIVFFVTLIVLGMVFLIHDQVIVRANTDIVLMRSANYYNPKYSIEGGDRDEKFGKISKSGRKLPVYWRFGHKNFIITNGDAIMKSQVDKYGIFKEKTRVNADSKSGFLYSKNTLRITRTNFLIDRVSRVLGLKNNGNHVYDNEMPIFDQAEFIRGLDLIKDVGIVLKNKFK